MKTNEQKLAEITAAIARQHEPIYAALAIQEATNMDAVFAQYVAAIERATAALTDDQKRAAFMAAVMDTAHGD